LLTKIVLLFISKVIRMQGHVKYVGRGGKIAAYRVSVETSGRPKRKWADNIKAYLQYIVLKGLD